MSTRHYFDATNPEGPTACGGTGYNFGAVTDRSLVTCKRCLASLAKRDRAFQRKARKGLAEFAWRARSIVCGPAVEAACAIAAEETQNGTPLGMMQIVIAAWSPHVGTRIALFSDLRSPARAIAREEGRA